MKRAIIVCNGEMNGLPPDLPLHAIDTLLIAADGGTRHCRRHKWVPNLVIGDGDSLTALDRQFIDQHRIDILRHPPEKDATDFELALRYASDCGIRQVIVLGALGGRWDMSCANMFLAAHQDFRNLRIFFKSPESMATVVHPGCVYQAQRSEGRLLTLLPIGGDASGVNVEGCRWPLRTAKLPLGTTHGVSNRIQARTARIEVEKGCLLVFQAAASSP